HHLPRKGRPKSASPTRSKPLPDNLVPPTAIPRSDTTCSRRDCSVRLYSDTQSLLNGVHPKRSCQCRSKSPCAPLSMAPPRLAKESTYRFRDCNGRLC